MKPGTVVKLQDGREATVVYNSLMGYGVKIGRLNLSTEQIDHIYQGDGNTVQDGNPTEDESIEPDALLRDPWPNAPMPCVGSKYEVITEREAGNE